MWICNIMMGVNNSPSLYIRRLYETIICLQCSAIIREVIHIQNWNYCWLYICIIQIEQKVAQPIPWKTFCLSESKLKSESKHNVILSVRNNYYAQKYKCSPLFCLVCVMPPGGVPSVILATHSWIFCFSFCNVYVLFLYTFSFANPPRQKSGGVRSGDCGATIFQEILWSWKNSHTISSAEFALSASNKDMLLSFLWRKWDQFILHQETPHHNQTYKECKSSVERMWIFDTPYFTLH